LADIFANVLGGLALQLYGLWDVNSLVVGNGLAARVKQG
jgi:hypothetical protein